MTTAKFDINNLRIASPCPVSWDTMSGDDRTRFCWLCDLNVYNVAGMTTAEVEQLLARNKGRLCMRLYRRADGTLLTKDCPVGVRGYRKRAAAFLNATFAAVLSLFSMSYGQIRDEKVTTVDAAKIEIVRSKGVLGGSILQGTIVDPNGAVVAGVEVNLSESGKLLTRNADSEGRFTFEGLREGKYELQIPAVLGFRKLVVENLELQFDEDQKLVLILIPEDVIEDLLGVVGVGEDIVETQPALLTPFPIQQRVTMNAKSKAPIRKPE